MKQKITRIKPDGSKEIVEYDDGAPAQIQNTAQIAAKGQGGDTQLAHVNPWEQALLKKLGGSGTTNPRTGLRQFDTNSFDFPTDIMPTSYSGLPSTYRDQLMSTLMPQLQSSISNMPQNIDQYTNQALGSYQQMMNNAIKTNIPKAISGLSNRGILNSTEGQGILGNVYSSAAMDASNKGYETAMQSALLKSQMPSVLGQIADLGKYTYQEDPTTMYRTLADLIKGMM